MYICEGLRYIVDIFRTDSVHYVLPTSILFQVFNIEL